MLIRGTRELTTLIGVALAASLLAATPLVPAVPVAPTGSKQPETPSLDLARYTGQVVLLDFWASWCAPCRESFPWMAQMLGTYGERGLVVVAVNLDEDPEAAARFLKGVPQKFVHLQDPTGRLAEAFGLTAMPTSILFDREGRPVYRHEGYQSDRAGEYERQVVDLLENRGPSTALTIGPVSARRLGVHPWQRGILADPAMELVSDPLESEFDDHMYFSKEASSGGRGFGGGGCGCN